MRSGIREDITGFRNQIAVFVGLGASTVENSVIVILLIISTLCTMHIVMQSLRQDAFITAEVKTFRAACSGYSVSDITARSLVYHLVSFSLDSRL